GGLSKLSRYAGCLTTYGFWLIQAIEDKRKPDLSLSCGLPIHNRCGPIVASPDGGSHSGMEFVSSNLNQFPIGGLKGLPSQKKPFCSRFLAEVFQGKGFSRVLIGPYPQKSLVVVALERQNRPRKRRQMIARTPDLFRRPEPLQRHSKGSDCRMNQQYAPQEPQES